MYACTGTRVPVQLRYKQLPHYGLCNASLTLSASKDDNGTLTSMADSQEGLQQHLAAVTASFGALVTNSLAVDTQSSRFLGACEGFGRQLDGVAAVVGPCSAAHLGEVRRTVPLRRDVAHTGRMVLFRKLICCGRRSEPRTS